MSSNCLLASMVSNEKSALNLIEDPLYVTSCFSLAAFNILYLSLSFNFDYNDVVLDLFTLSYLAFIEILGCVDNVFDQIWEVFSHCLFQIFFLTLSFSLLLGLP